MKEKHGMTTSKNPLRPEEVIPENQQYNGGIEQGFVRVSTGVVGLDEILYGGLIQKRAYLLRGGPGGGKTTLGLHFLTEGVAQGERSLFITLGEPEAELRANANAIGFDLTQVHFLDLSPNVASSPKCKPTIFFLLPKSNASR
jgi:predicted ATP-dependent serine protease